MIRKGDYVFFLSGRDSRIYQAASDTYENEGRQVVDLVGHWDEVEIKYLATIGTLFEEGI
jgi:hypothetical protein